MTPDLAPSALDDATLERYLAGNATADDTARVTEWLAAHEGRTRFLHALRTDAATKATPPTWNIDAALVESRRRRHPHTTVAANTRSATTPRIAQQTKPNTWYRTLAGAGAIALVLAAAWTLRTAVTPTAAPPDMAVWTAPAGQIASRTLPDGSQVTLAPGSRLHYDRRFGHDTRTVTLEGEAVFTVVRHARHPFTVNAGATVLRVLGTTFGVQTAANGTGVRVAIAEGKVAIASATNAEHSTVLTPGDVALADTTGAIAVTRNENVVALLAWTTGRLEFHNAPVHEITDRLTQWYGVTFRVPPSVATRRFTVSIDNAPPDSAAQLLAVLLHCRVSRQGDVITFTE